MKKKLCVLFIVFIINSIGTQGFCNDCGCRNNKMVGLWIEENDAAALELIRRWIKGEPLSELSSQAAVILSNNIYIQTKCFCDKEFLDAKGYFAGDESRYLTIEKLPAILIERMIGEDVFTPELIKNEE